MKLIAANLEGLSSVAEEFLKCIEGKRIIAFYGPMGSGKTTFITALCKTLGVEDVVNSPTFTIVNEYRTEAAVPVYHFDFYRINKIQEALDLGFYEYMESDGLCLIEWPENIEELLPEETLKVFITVNNDGERVFSFAE